MSSVKKKKKKYVYQINECLYELLGTRRKLCGPVDAAGCADLPVWKGAMNNLTAFFTALRCWTNRNLWLTVLIRISNLTNSHSLATALGWINHRRGTIGLPPPWGRSVIRRGRVAFDWSSSRRLAGGKALHPLGEPARPLRCHIPALLSPSSSALWKLDVTSECGRCWSASQQANIGTPVLQERSEHG